MAECIQPVQELIGGNCFIVLNSSRDVKRVYDTNGSGVLFPVSFAQEGVTVRLMYQPSGQVYYKYRKSN